MNKQSNAKFFNSSLLKFNYLIRLFTFFIFIFSTNIAAQDSLRDFLNTKTKQPVKTTSSTKKTSDKPRNPSKTTPRTTKKTVANTKRNLIEVTFISGEPLPKSGLTTKNPVKRMKTRGLKRNSRRANTASWRKTNFA